MTVRRCSHDRFLNTCLSWGLQRQVCCRLIPSRSAPSAQQKNCQCACAAASPMELHKLATKHTGSDSLLLAGMRAISEVRCPQAISTLLLWPLFALDLGAVHNSA